MMATSGCWSFLVLLSQTSQISGALTEIVERTGGNDPPDASLSTSYPPEAGFEVDKALSLFQVSIQSSALKLVRFVDGGLTRARTLDPLIKSRVLRYFS